MGSRRNLNTSINSAENLADIGYQQQMVQAKNLLKTSSSSLGRTESYKQARGGGDFEQVDHEEETEGDRLITFILSS